MILSTADATLQHAVRSSTPRTRVRAIPTPTANGTESTMHSPLLPQPEEFVANVMDWMLLAMWAMFVFALLVATSRVAPSYTVTNTHSDTNNA